MPRKYNYSGLAHLITWKLLIASEFVLLKYPRVTYVHLFEK